MSEAKVVVSSAGLELIVDNLVNEIRASLVGLSRVAIVGIQRGGVPVAERIYQKLVASPPPGCSVFFGIIDSSFNRDDVGDRGSFEVFPTHIDFDVEGNHVILVDDVISSGRTIRAALNSLMQLGRPLWVRLAVLVDRGHRQLPIQPDYVGWEMYANPTEKIVAHLHPSDPEQNFIELRHGSHNKSGFSS
jgi:pyrimidine operon attenuation protein / uracil phosphoribosyltransferase